MEGNLKLDEIEQDEKDHSPDALTERTLRTVADRIRQMDGRYKGDGDIRASQYTKQ